MKRIKRKTKTSTINGRVYKWKDSDSLAFRNAFKKSESLYMSDPYKLVDESNTNPTKVRAQVLDKVRLITRAYKESDPNITSENKAFEKLNSREVFKSKEQRYKENLIKGLKNQNDEEFNMKSFRKDRGWLNKLDYDKLEYNYDAGTYIYRAVNGEILIFFQESPQQGGSPIWKWQKQNQS